MNVIVAGLAALALLIALIFGIQKWEDSNREDGIAVANSKHNADAVKEIERQRQVEQARSKKQQEAQDENRKQRETDLRDRNLAIAQRDRVQLALDTERNSRPASSDPSLIECRKTTDTFGKLFGQCTERYTVLGERADESYRAGKLSEQSYDALSPDLKAMATELNEYVNREPTKEK